MTLRMLAVVPLLLLLIWLAGCAPPTPPTGQQLEEYARYAELRATEAAASQTIAAAKATEAAAANTLARLTAEALGAAAPITPTSTVTPSAVLTGTAIGATATVTVTAAITPTPTLTATTGMTASLLGVTATVSPTRAPLPTASPAAVTPSPTPSPTQTVSPTPTWTSTPSPTSSPTATATATSTPTPAATSATEEAPATTVTATLALTRTSPALLFLPFSSFTPTAALTATVAPPASTPAPTPAPLATAVVSSEQANVRSGPGIEYDILGSLAQGAQLGVLGKNDNSTWWYVCCLDGQPGWVSSTIVRVQGDTELVPVQPPLLPDDLQAAWAVRWQCHAEGCKQSECLGNSRASALRVRTSRWLEVKRDATWENACGQQEDWLTDVDRYSGKEQQSQAGQPLFAIWAGRNPGPETRRIDLLDRSLSLWCTGTRTREVEQNDGWTIVYEGEACYDRAAGVLTTLQYAKRWLYTGTFAGQQYDRQYFGDYEVYQQILTGTNVPLSGD